MLTNKVVLITGGSRGIGAAIAKKLSSHGASIAISYNSSPGAAKEIINKLIADGKKAIAIQADNSNPKAVTALINNVVSEFGGIDVLINNAGTFMTENITDQDSDVFETLFNLNVRGVYQTTRAAIHHLRDGGRIINIGSALAVSTLPGVSAYCATKAAVAAMTKSWAKELAPRKITVNTVRAGSVNTDLNPDITQNPFAAVQKTLNPLGRFGTVDEIASAVAYLVSDDAGFVTGSELAIDGGMTA